MDKCQGVVLMLISITGRLGSGKSTVCNILKERYGFEIYSTGAVQREYARGLGISTLELNQRMEEHPNLDAEIDNMVTKISIERADEKLIFDSRMAWHFAKNTFKIFLTIEPCEAASRVMKNQRGDEEKYCCVDEACEKLVERSRIERARFKEIYGVDYYDYNNFNIVIDTTSKTPDEVVAIIVENHAKYLENAEEYNTPHVF